MFSIWVSFLRPKKGCKKVFAPAVKAPVVVSALDIRSVAFFGVLLLLDEPNTLAWMALKEVADGTGAGVDGKGVGFTAHYLHQRCILRPQGLKPKHEDANPTLSTSSIAVFFHPGYDHDVYASTHCASDDDSHTSPRNGVVARTSQHPHLISSFPQYWDTASASPPSTRPHRERVYVPSRDTNVKHDARTKIQPHRSHPDLATTHA
ncbi:hypothetical protein CPC08DRAFT_728061 [Agrocybe pediades]|nr:hypothetical protein CPC08DRAFT_728061 [Agrocybe pediades]